MYLKTFFHQVGLYIRPSERRAQTLRENERIMLFLDNGSQRLSHARTQQHNYINYSASMKLGTHIRGQVVRHGH
jgi:hypothetical protein